MRGLSIRLLRQGCTNRPFFHIVVSPTSKGTKHEGLEQLGTYDPMVNKHGETLCAMNFERIKHWIRKGAEPTKPVAQLLGKILLVNYFPRIVLGI